MSEQDKVVYRYTPVNEGDSYATFGVPVRDLTEADVAKLSGFALASLAAEWRKDKPIYTKVLTKEESAAKKAADESEKKAAEEAEKKAAEEAERAAKKAAEEAAKAEIGA